MTTDGTVPAETTKTINTRPGDDFVLRFALVEHEDAVGPYDGQYKDATGGIDDANYPGFMAVYDKKMLWRANLYIDEGANDWNIKNPWNAPPDRTAEDTMRNRPVDPLPSWWSAEWGYNEWNRADHGTDYVGNWMLLLAGNGKQVITFVPWTRYNGELASSNSNNYFNRADLDLRVDNAVAYTEGSIDSPFAFKREMIEQKLFNRSPNTTAPGNGSWLSYLPDGDLERLDTLEEKNGIQPVLGSYPYRPNYSAIEQYDFYNIDTKGQRISAYNADIHPFVSSGVDCNGFLTRIASYSGSNYLFPRWSNDTAESTWTNGNGSP